MNALLDLETKLSILANNPCTCVVCREAAQLAKRTLIDVVPSAAVLLDLPAGSPAFEAAELTFQREETARLEQAYDLIGRGRCEFAPELQPDRQPPTIAQAAPPDIPSLPDPELFRAQIELYRKHQMKPRTTQRRGRSITMLKRPRVPGSYLIK